MYGRNPAHYAEYWKAVQELWLRLYLSKLIIMSAINVSAPTPAPGDTQVLTFLGQTDLAEKRPLGWDQGLVGWNEL